MKKSLIIGYGNPDREDDGVAWHILRALTVKLGLFSPSSYEDEFPEFAPINLALGARFSNQRFKNRCVLARCSFWFDPRVYCRRLEVSVVEMLADCLVFGSGIK